MTIARWIDLGCPINNGDGGDTAYGWFLDENRPTLTMALPAAGRNAELNRLLIGMHDYGTGLDAKSFRIVR